MPEIESSTAEPHTSLRFINSVRALLLALTLGLLSSCARLNEEQPSAAQEPSEVALVRPTLQPLLTAMLAPMDETVVERTIAQLPIATSVERAPVQNRHYPQRIDVVKTLRYDGLSVAIYEVTELDKSLLWAVTVSQRGLRDASLKVGQPLAKAFSSLGNPVATSGNSIAYLNTDAAGTPYLLTITHNDRLIDSLEWRIILD